MNTDDTDKYPTQPLSRRDVEEADTTLPSPVPTEVHTSPSPPPVRPYQPAQVDQEQIVTPPPYHPAPLVTDIPPQPPRLGCLRFLVGLCLVITLASLVLNVVIIYAFLNVQRKAVEGVDQAVSALDNLGGEGFHYDYRFERTIPVSASIPIKQDMIFPFNGNFPINTTVRVPIDAGVLGTIVIDVPINTSIHVDTQVPVHIDQNFDISTTFPISMSIPIDVKADDPAIQDLVGKLRAWLLELRQELQGGLIPALSGR